ncbi:MAG: transposase [Chloroflexi bacterium]|nr:transposase [Chloroflexota bacterium]
MVYRDQARNNLTSGKGIRLRSERCIEVGTVFGQIKHNTGFRRFMHRGIEKVNIEWGEKAILRSNFTASQRGARFTAAILTWWQRFPNICGVDWLRL